MTKTVVIVGGGIAGLSVAHELLKRNDSSADFRVRIFERGAAAGGKARSVLVPPPSRARHSGAPRSRELPGEHGFHFFPGFYQHLPNTLEDIPVQRAGIKSVAQALVDAPRLELARVGRPPVVVQVRIPRTLQDWTLLFQDAFSDVGVSRVDLAFYAARIWQVMTSCNARSLAQYETVSWWSFIDAERRSAAYRELLAEGLSRSLLANDPRTASARTVGTTNARLLQGLFGSSGADRVLNGPTSEVWIEPWLHHLHREYAESFQFHHSTCVTRIRARDNRIVGVVVERGPGDSETVTADYFVFCLPVERMAELMDASARDGSADLVALDESLAGIPKLAKSVAWMNGIQFFLYQPAPIVTGHCLYVDSAWALTSISEGQFWQQADVINRGDGTVRDILSVCISNWNTNGILYGRPARDLTHEQIAKEVWAQLKAALNVNGAVVLRDENLHSYFLDPDIVRDNPVARASSDRYNDMEPLFVNGVGTWALRPQSTTKIANLFLASDYVQTRTDVACMEGANEAARMAVNAVLRAAGARAEECELFDLDQPAFILKPLQRVDDAVYALNLPWSAVPAAAPAPRTWISGAAAAPGTADPRRPTAGDSALPPYRARSAEQTSSPPYECAKTRLYGFVVKANAKAMQEKVVDRWLNACAGDTFDFHVASDHVLVTFTSAKELRSLAPEERAKGFTPEKACVVWVSVLTKKPEPKLFAFAHYIVVDNPWSVASGREVHGFPKELGDLTVPEEGESPTTLGVSTLVLRQFAPDQSTEWKSILEVRRGTPADTVGEGWLDVAGTMGNVLGHWIRQSSPGAVPAWDVVRGALEAVKTHGVPLLFLKQFRDASDGTRACVQRIVEASASVTGFRKAGLQTGRFELIAATFASHPIGSDLGLAAERVPVEASFFLDFDFALEAGKEIWKGA